ncbi:hypothetical protein I7I48_10965 [Histoplasma ohiense]|nr:hypothetical protein I7I48_10965 [Histoplasma ohiense (nom. inval.)]
MRARVSLASERGSKRENFSQLVKDDWLVWTRRVRAFVARDMTRYFSFSFSLLPSFHFWFLTQR